MSVTVRNVTKFFGKTRAVDNISFSIGNGEIVGFLGPNGAGKTTTARLITGYLAPSFGIVEVNGKNVQKFSTEVRKTIGYLPEENPLYTDVDVLDYLEFIARMQHVPKSEIRKRVQYVVKIFGLYDVKHQAIAELSKGFRQRVGIAQAVVHNPNVLVLDEPTNGLDPNQVMELRQIIAHLGKSKTIIFSTHALAEVQALCTRVIIMGRGRILIDAPIEELREKFHGREGFLVEIERSTEYDEESVQRTFESLDTVEAVAPLVPEETDNRAMKFYLESRNNIDIRKEVFELCIHRRLLLVNLQRKQVRIEEIFHQLTTGKASP